MRISILTAKKTIYEGAALKAILPCQDGEVCILDYHQPFVFGLGKGSVRIYKKWEGGKTMTIKIKKGIAKMAENELICTISPLF